MSGCTQVEVKEATDAEKKQVTTIYADCSAQAIQAMDDGKSDAYTVASAASTACGREFENLLAVYSKGQTGSAKVKVRERFTTHRKEWLVPIVLKVRKEPK